MNREPRRPPAIATWLLLHLCSRKDREVLTGDLLERFGEGESPGWFRRQVAVAILSGVARDVRDHWPQVLFSIAGAPLLWFCGGPLIGLVLGNLVAAGVWSWGFHLLGPMSELYDLAFRSILVALMVQPLLAAVLLADGSFRWLRMLRTLVLSVPLIAATALLWALWSATRFSSSLVFLPMILSTLLVSAWLGCRAPADSPWSSDGVLLSARAALTGLMVICALQTAGGLGDSSWWTLDELSRLLTGRLSSYGISSHWTIPAEILVLAFGCGWLAGWWNRGYYRTMLAGMAISWTVLFGYATVSYWGKMAGDAVAHPWFRTYLADYSARFLFAIVGVLLGGRLGRRERAPLSVAQEGASH